MSDMDLITDDILKDMIVAEALLALAEELEKTEAAGPCGYWNKQLIVRISNRAHLLLYNAGRKMADNIPKS